MILRLAVIAVAGVLLGVQVVRNAAVAELSQSHPAQAARLWSDHPDVEMSLGMTDIARAARARAAVPVVAFSMMRDAAAKEPLAAEPFMVRGVQAELSGNGKAAQRAFEAAQWRDPRSLAAAYFLADRYFRAGDVERGLGEVAALAHLSPNGNVAVAPYLAAYAKGPSNWPALRTMFRANPDLADPALTVLAANPGSASAVLALADPKERLEDAHWLPALLNTLVASGQYDQARSIWVRATGAKPVLLHDSSFGDKRSPPPFNWSLTSSAVGVAERQAGRLHVVFYGQQDGILAGQLLVLPPGLYRLSMQLVGDQAHAHALTWSLWCDKSGAPISSVSLDVAASRSWSFTVPNGCPAQWLRLSGMSADMPQQVDVTVGELKLEKAGPSA